MEQERQQKLQEQQRVEQEQHKLQEAQASEAKRQVQLRQEDLVNKDKIVQEQATLLAKSWKPTKPLPYNKSEKEAEVRKKVQEMQKKRNELKKVKVSYVEPDIYCFSRGYSCGAIATIFVPEFGNNILSTK